MAADYGGCEDGDEDDDWGENVGEWCDVDYVDNIAMFWFNIYSNWFNSFFFFIWLNFIGEMMKIVKWWPLMFDYFN